MNLMRWVRLCWCVAVVLGDASVRRAGWLDRAVSYLRTNFQDDVEKTAPIEIRASLMRVPAAKDEAKLWDYQSVERLLSLLGASPRAAPVRRALRRALRPSAPTRRFISKKLSWKLFPSHGKNHQNEIYYDFDPTDSSSSEEIESSIYSDDSVIVLDNPVEARLPSAKISVKLLRDILEARAKAARMMPTTAKSTIPWVTMSISVTSTENKTGAAANNGTQVQDEAAKKAAEEEAARKAAKEEAARKAAEEEAAKKAAEEAKKNNNP